MSNVVILDALLIVLVITRYELIGDVEPLFF